MEVYCFKCRVRKEILNPQNIRKGGYPATQGQCPTCGSIIVGMVRTPDNVKEPSSSARQLSAKPPIVPDIFRRRHKTEDEWKSLGILQSPADSFSLYSTREEVALSQGVPESRTTYRMPDHYSFNWYGGSSGQISRGESGGSYFYKTLGESNLQRFVFLQTNPLKKRGFHLCGNDKGYEVWTYGDSGVVFGTMPDCLCEDCSAINYVRAWANAGELRLTDFTITANKSGLNYGMQVDHVLQSQGNPSLIFPESYTHSHTVTLSSPPNEGAQVFYYFNPKDLRQTDARDSSGYTFFRLSQEPSSIYIVPAAQTSADTEYVKEHGHSKLQPVAQKVISWTNNGHLRVSSTSEVAEEKSKLDEESKKRFIDCMKLEDLFNSMESPASLNPNSKTILDDFLNQSSNLNTYEKGLKFEQFCKRILEAMGYEVEHSGQSGDRGVDLKAVDRDPIKGLTLVVQCKHQESVSADVVIQTYGMVNSENANKGLVMTTGSFTADAKKFAEENSAIEIIDGNQLADLVKQYLEG